MWFIMQFTLQSCLTPILFDLNTKISTTLDRIVWVLLFLSLISQLKILSATCNLGQVEGRVESSPDAIRISELNFKSM